MWLVFSLLAPHEDSILSSCGSISHPLINVGGRLRPMFRPLMSAPGLQETRSQCSELRYYNLPAASLHWSITKLLCNFPFCSPQTLLTCLFNPGPNFTHQTKTNVSQPEPAVYVGDQTGLDRWFLSTGPGGRGVAV